MTRARSQGSERRSRARDEPAAAGGAETRPRARVLRSLMRAGGLFAAAFGVLCALVLGIAWLLFTGLDQHRDRVAGAVGDLLGQRVSIGTVEASWDGLSPVLRLRDVRIYAHRPRDASSVARIADAEIALAPIDSLRAGALRSRRVRVTGAALTLTREANGAVRVVGLTDPEDVATTIAPSEPGAGQGALARLLFAQRALELHSTRVDWLTAGPEPHRLRLENVNLSFHSVGARREVRGWLSLADRTGSTRRGTVALRAEVRGDPSRPEWDATAELRATELPLGELAPFIGAALPSAGPGPRPPSRIRGSGTFELTLGIRRGTLTGVRGRLAVSGLGVAAADVAGSAPLSAEASFELTREDAAWKARIEPMRIERGTEEWPTRRLEVRWQRGDGEPLRFGLAVDALGIDDAALLAGTLVDAETRDRLVEAHPSGRLSGLRLQGALDHDALSISSLRADVAELGLGASERLPGVRGLSGAITLRGTEGELVLAGGAADPIITLPAIYARPLRLGGLRGTVRWAHGELGTVVWSERLEADVRGAAAQAAGHVFWVAGDPAPHLAVDLAVGPGEIQALRPLALVNELPDGVLDWIRSALLEGRMESARVRLRGRGDRLPFGAGPEGFTVDAVVNGATVDYAAGWPAVRGTGASVRMRGPHLAVDVSAGSVLGTAVESATVAVEDVTAHPRRLRFAGRFAGPAGDTLAFVRSSPLASRYAELLEGIEASGPSTLDLRLGLAIDGNDPVAIDAALRLAGAGIDRGRGLRLDAIEGVIRLDAEGLHAEGLRASYLGAPVAVAVARQAEPYPATVIDVDGVADRAFLERQLAALATASSTPPTLDWLSGAAPWRLRYLVPDGAGGPTPSLAVDSTLAGIALDLPGSLAKAAADRTPLAIEVSLDSAERRVVHGRYGEQWRAALALVRRQAGWATERGTVRVGGEPARLPATPGVVVEGTLPSVDFDSWRRLLARSATDRPRLEGGWLGDSRRVALDVERIEGIGQSLAARRLELERAADGWTARVRGPDVSGTVRVPLGPGETVEIELDRLVLRALARDAPGAAVDPRSLPPIRARVVSMRYGDGPPGALELTTTPYPPGLQVTGLELSTPAFDVSATGSWSFDAGRHSTALSARVRAPALGPLLQAIGRGEVRASGGESDILLELAWLGPPAEPGLDDVTGTMHVRIREGRLIDVPSGLTGRAVGLVNLAALPRHLRGDFSHIFGKGFSFDDIEGSFAFERGSAYTNDLRMSGPAARIDLAGRIGLVAEDYDQIVTVTPRLASSLPLAPIWLAEKVLERRVFDGAFAARYTLTGSWHAPKLTPVIAAAGGEEDR